MEIEASLGRPRIGPVSDRLREFGRRTIRFMMVSLPSYGCARCDPCDTLYVIVSCNSGGKPKRKCERDTSPFASPMGRSRAKDSPTVKIIQTSKPATTTARLPHLLSASHSPHPVVAVRELTTDGAALPSGVRGSPFWGAGSYGV